MPIRTIKSRTLLVLLSTSEIYMLCVWTMAISVLAPGFTVGAKKKILNRIFFNLEEFISD